MLIDRDREKLLQAVVFFALHTRKLGKTKLFKLLYFLDFKHFRETGRSVTGLQYFAWPKGPVPVSLYGELDAPEPDWDGKVAFSGIDTGRGPMLSVRAQSDFDPSHFSRRELAILEGLAAEYRDTEADDMIEATHLENSPWHTVWVERGQRQQEIPYELALRRQDDEVLREAAREHAETKSALRG
jgi:uncharacterized phage-associated protein